MFNYISYSNKILDILACNNLIVSQSLIRFLFSLFCIGLTLLISNNTFGQEHKSKFFITTGAAPGSAGTHLPLLRINDANTVVNAPNISYPSPQNYVINKTISPLTPSNSGGAVPATVYGKANTVATGFNEVTGVTVDDAGYVYFADFGTNQIKKISPAGVVTLWAGSPSGISGLTNGQGTAATFTEPDALAIDAAGNIYVGDSYNNALRKITPAGVVSTFAGNGTAGSQDGTGAAASFYNLRGMAFDASGNIYVADQGNNLIRKVTPAGVVSTIAGSTSAGFINGPAASARFNTPVAVTVDTKGNIYVSDLGNNAIRKISAAGEVSTFASNLNGPRELRADGTDNIYVVEQNSNSIKRISPDGTVALVAASGPNLGSSNGLIGLWPDGKGNLFVGDGQSIRKVIVSGYVIDKPLPPGLLFDPTTGIISGTPAQLWPSTNYTITAFNGGGSKSAVVNIQILSTLPSVITLPPQTPGFLDENEMYDPLGTSTNPETPITYTSSNTSVAEITPDGRVHVLAPGVTIITAHQAGNANYSPATPVSQTLTVVEYLSVKLPSISNKSICSADFPSNATAFEKTIPITYVSSNTSVASIDVNGLIHITGPGSTTITVSQPAPSSLYVSAVPQSQTFTVNLPVSNANISASYSGNCEGNSVSFKAAAVGTGINPQYQWQVNGNNAGENSATFVSDKLSNNDKVTCSISNTDSECLAGYPEQSNIITINLTPQTIPEITITASADYLYQGLPVTFTAHVKSLTGPGVYQWQVNGINVGEDSPSLTTNILSNNDIVTCTITPSVVCSTPKISNELTVHVLAKLEIPNAFTPNGDGVNDKWEIHGIANYPDCVLKIFNRYGVEVFRSIGYYNAWDGTYNGQPVPVSTYYYTIDTKQQNLKFSGYLLVIK